MDVLARTARDRATAADSRRGSALQLRNTSDVENEQILNSLGRVAPADGTGVEYDETWVRHVAGDLKSANPCCVAASPSSNFRR